MLSVSIEECFVYIDFAITIDFIKASQSPGMSSCQLRSRVSCIHGLVED